MDTQTRLSQLQQVVSEGPQEEDQEEEGGRSRLPHDRVRRRRCLKRVVGMWLWRRGR
jgi:hypothetical protein